MEVGEKYERVEKISKELLREEGGDSERVRKLLHQGNSQPREGLKKPTAKKK